MAATAKPRFGDLVENGWASEENPTRRGFFVREIRNGARRTWEITDGKGKFWRCPLDSDHKLTWAPAASPPLEGAGREEDGSSRSQPVLSPESDNADGWIRWNGGACPVATGTPIDVRYRDGQELLCLPADRLADSSRDASEAFWRNDDCENDIVAYRLALADGALGRQDEVVQPIRDEPISSSKWEALPVVSEEMVEAACRAAWKFNTYDPDMDAEGEPLWKTTADEQRAALTAALSLPRPASDKVEEAVAWRRKPKSGSRGWQLFDDPNDHAFYVAGGQYDIESLYARPVPGVSREEVARIVASWIDKAFSCAIPEPWEVAEKYGQFAADEILGLASKGDHP